MTTSSKPMHERCPWCGSTPLYQAYHDQEWGVPEWDDKALLEKLILDGAQAGLAWITILRKREGYRRAFANFDPETLAAFSDEKLAQLQQDSAIVRNRLKIASARRNARAYLAIQEGPESFPEFLWKFVDGAPIQNYWHSMAEVPVVTPEAEAMSKALKKAGFNFVGPTIVYAFMQAVGMVNDHLVGCHRHQVVMEMKDRRLQLVE